MGSKNDYSVQSTVENSELGTFTYKWEIGDWISRIDECYAPGSCETSLGFEILNRSWCLRIYPDGKDEKSQGFTCITIFHELDIDRAYNWCPIDVRYAFTLATSENHVIGHFDSVKKERFDTEDQVSRDVNTLIKKSFITECVKSAREDKLVIFGKIMTQEGGLRETLLTRGNVATQHLLALEKFINNERFSDVKFKLEGKEIFAHKMMLSAHSPVFSAMFEHEMLENTENVVAIEDIRHDVFCDLLRFVYLGKIDFEKGSVTDLFKAADKYQLSRLKSLCENELCRSMSVGNVFAYLSLGDTHNAADLKKRTVDFIVDHISEIIPGPQVNSLKKLDTSIFREILQRITKQTK